MKIPKTIKSLEEIINNYDIFILDQWGVMHDGIKGFHCAVKSVEKLSNLNKNLIIVSNSSKRKNLTIQKLPSLGFNSEKFFEVMTSGEMTWQYLNRSIKNFKKNNNLNCYYIRDKSNKDSEIFVSGLEEYNFVEDIEEADFILGRTLKKQSKSSDFLPLLLKALKKNIPFYCANPDYVSIENNKFNICMGTIAELYKSLGGKIIIFGKPNIEIYIESLKKIKKLEKSRILAVGDSIYHDIKGANSYGVDSVLITSGIHQSFFYNDNPIWESKINKFAKLDILPTYLCSKFII